MTQKITKKNNFVCVGVGGGGGGGAPIIVLAKELMNVIF